MFNFHKDSWHLQMLRKSEKRVRVSVLTTCHSDIVCDIFYVVLHYEAFQNEKDVSLAGLLLVFPLKFYKSLFFFWLSYEHLHSSDQGS